MTQFLPLPLRVVSAEWADRVPSPAHDTLTGQQRQSFIAANPESYLSVTQSHEDRPGSSPEDILRVNRAALEQLVKRGAFGHERAPVFYLYQLEQYVDGQPVHRQTGVVGGVAISDFEHGELRPHEQIHAERAAQMAANLDAVGVQSSPVVVAVRPDSGLAPLLKVIEAESGRPLVVAHSPDGLVQRIWAIEDPHRGAEVSAVLRSRATYLIDGHHRAAAMALHRAHVEAASGQPAGDDAQLLLAAVFPSDELLNRPFHRRVLGTTVAAIIEAADDRVAWRPVTATTDPTAAEVVLRDDHQMVAISLPAGTGNDASGPPSSDRLTRELADLDAVRIDRWLLEDTLGLDPARRDPRVVYVPGAGFGKPEPTTAGSVLCLAHPVPIELILDAADAGMVLPPKSTYFEPKARSGVFLRTL